MNALETLGLGPRGGNLDLPSVTAKKEWRTSELNATVLPNGEMGLHRFEIKPDTATIPKKDEQPWHRMAAYMLNAGRTNSEIAVAAGVTPYAVTHLRAQRWFQELCAVIANANGEELLGAIRAEALDSLNVIVDIRDALETPSRVRLSAAQIILEQAHGKPTQKVVSDVTHSVRRSPQEEMSEIQQELAAIRDRKV